MVPELKDLTYEETLKELQQTKLKKIEKGDLITTCKLMNNFAESEKDQIMRKTKQKIAKRNLLKQHRKSTTLSR